MRLMANCNWAGTQLRRNLCGRAVLEHWQYNVQSFDLAFEAFDVLLLLLQDLVDVLHFSPATNCRQV